MFNTHTYTKITNCENKFFSKKKKSNIDGHHHYHHHHQSNQLIIKLSTNISHLQILFRMFNNFICFFFENYHFS